MATTTWSIPGSVPSTAHSLDPMPVGVSFEFFMWPSYMTNITPPLLCLEHFTDLYGEKPPVRIGGSTQDRAAFDPDLDAYVSYHVDDPLAAPDTLTYGPSFFDLIDEYGAETILGVNRGDDNLPNTLEAVLVAQDHAGSYIDGIELGNEPDLYYYIWKKPVATPPWNASQEGANAAEWAQSFIDVWDGPEPILVGGVYAMPPPAGADWSSTDYLIEHSYNDSVKAATKVYNTHLYAFTNESLATAMSHTTTVTALSEFIDLIATAKSVDRPYIIGETGMHSYDNPHDATFGGALQVLDKTLWALSIGIQRLYYHQGTINQALFDWWSDDQVNAPFYGAYMAALATADGDHVVASDAGDTTLAQYIIYKDGAPKKLLLINTDYYSGSGTRSSKKAQVTGLSKKNVDVVRMTGPSSGFTIKAGTTPNDSLTIGGQHFSHSDCSKDGAPAIETACVKKGRLSLTVAASEAVLVYL